MWFYTALITSIVSAILVIVSKRLLKGVSASVLTWGTLLLSTPIILIFTIKEGLPSLNSIFFVGVSGSVVLYTISRILNFQSMKIEDLSAVYPLVSLGPIFTLVVALLPPLSERPSALAVLGVVITLFGSYILGLRAVKEGVLQPIRLLFENKASFLMILSAVFESIVIVFDKIAINNTSSRNPTFTLLVENLIVISGLLPILYVRNRSFTRDIFSNVKWFMLVGILNAIMTILAFSAVSEGDVAVVSTILKSQVLFVLVLSYIFFKDKPKLETILGSIMMIIGVVLIKGGT